MAEAVKLDTVNENLTKHDESSLLNLKDPLHVSARKRSLSPDNEKDSNKIRPNTEADSSLGECYFYL